MQNFNVLLLFLSTIWTAHGSLSMDAREVAAKIAEISRSDFPSVNSHHVVETETASTNSVWFYTYLQSTSSCSSSVAQQNSFLTNTCFFGHMFACNNGQIISTSYSDQACTTQTSSNSLPANFCYLPAYYYYGGSNVAFSFVCGAANEGFVNSVVGESMSTSFYSDASCSTLIESTTSQTNACFGLSNYGVSAPSATSSRYSSTGAQSSYAGTATCANTPTSTVTIPLNLCFGDNPVYMKSTLTAASSTRAPTKVPTKAPTRAPTIAGTVRRSNAPTVLPTRLLPTTAPTRFSTPRPSRALRVPSVAPSQCPSVRPSKRPTRLLTV